MYVRRNSLKKKMTSHVFHNKQNNCTYGLRVGENVGDKVGEKLGDKVGKSVLILVIQ